MSKKNKTTKKLVKAKPITTPKTLETDNNFSPSKKPNSVKTILFYTSIILMLAVVYLIFNILFFSQKNNTQASCINSKEDAEKFLRNNSDVKKYFKSIRSDSDIPYINIQGMFNDKSETKIGYAFVGKKSENNSVTLYAKYIFMSGCNVKFQKQPKNNDETYGPITFYYNYKIAQKTYRDETKQCLKRLSRITTFDIDKDGENEYLYACFMGGSTTAHYSLYKQEEGKIKILDSFNSTGYYEEIADFNNDGFFDVATVGILMDEKECQGDKCFAPFKELNTGKQLLKRSYHRIWNPTLNKFNPPEKAEIYYQENDKKIIIK